MSAYEPPTAEAYILSLFARTILGPYYARTIRNLGLKGDEQVLDYGSGPGVAARHIVARNGARVELLGGVSYQSWKNQPVDPPMFTVVDSEASFTIGFYHWNQPFTTIVEETLGGETRTLPRKGLGHYHLPVYRAGGR